MIAKISSKVASWGSAEEIYNANRAKKPIFLIVEEGKQNCPLWLWGVLKPSYIYNNEDEVIEVIKKINSGDIVADSSRWRLLKPSLR